MRSNAWTQHALQLAEAYVRSAGSIRFEVVTRQLLLYLPRSPQRVIDVGGGDGRQAVMLARAGHRVVVLDIDPGMLARAERLLAGEPREVVSKIDLVLADGLDPPAFVGMDFDLACCHSVLAYEEDPAPMIDRLVQLVRTGGLISVVCINREAIAMRSALEGRWQDAAGALFAGAELGASYLPVRAHSRREISSLLEQAGANVVDWQGVGVFTDHVGSLIDRENAADALKVEWIAGNRDPYRQVARCFHLIAEKLGNALPAMRSTSD